MRVEIIRHGETAYQAQGRYQGRTDLPLSEEGRKKLCPSEKKPKQVFVTGLLRSRETAEILFPLAEQLPTQGLEEMDFGIFEGRNYIEMQDDMAYRSWVESGCLTACPGGESKADFCQRVCSSFSRLLEEEEKKGREELILLAHGGSQMAVMEAFCREKRDYFDWHLGSGKGYLLLAENWQKKKELELLGITDYNRKRR